MRATYNTPLGRQRLAVGLRQERRHAQSRARRCRRWSWRRGKSRRIARSRRRRTAGPRKAMKRGALKVKASPVARERVGNSSGSHTAIQEYCPSVKNALTAAATNSSVGSVRPQEQHRRHDEGQREIQHGDRLAAEAVGEEAEADIAEDGAEIVSHAGVARPLRAGQAGLGRRPRRHRAAPRTRCPTRPASSSATSGRR